MKEGTMATLMDLIRKLRSPDNKCVLQSIEELRARGWLEDGSLNGIPLCHAHMQGADLFKADLSSVDLHQAHLDSADLSLANLTGTRLTRADLRAANMNRAVLEGTDLFKANLREVRNLIPAQLAQAKRLWGAVMPDGSTYDGRYNLPGDVEFAKWGGVDPTNVVAMAEFFGVELAIYLKGQEEIGQLAVR
jgi:uncharacterized protein YjbI with pentapeptide repeats